MKPDFDQHHFQARELANTPSETRLASWSRRLALLRDVILEKIGRPARRGRRVPIGAAGVDADRQAVRSRGAIDRPVVPAAQRHVEPTPSSSTWTKRGSPARRSISSAASSGFCDGTTIEARSRGSRSSHSCRDPVVDRADERRRHVLGEQRRRPGAVEDGEARAERVERLRLEQREIGAGRAFSGRQSARPESGAVGG